MARERLLVMNWCATLSRVSNCGEATAKYIYKLARRDVTFSPRYQKEIVVWEQKRITIVRIQGQPGACWN